MGLFIHRSHNGGRAFAVHRAQMQAARRREIDRFAENLAEGASIAGAAALIGKTVSWGERAFRDIRRGLGWQAR
jgi:AmiR/NasT family two-component response regulator